MNTSYLLPPCPKNLLPPDGVAPDALPMPCPALSVVGNSFRVEQGAEVFGVLALEQACCTIDLLQQSWVGIFGEHTAYEGLLFYSQRGNRLAEALDSCLECSCSK